MPVGPTSSVVNVASGGSAQANFAVQAQGVIQGVVFDDRNGNSEQDSGGRASAAWSSARATASRRPRA